MNTVVFFISADIVNFATINFNLRPVSTTSAIDSRTCILPVTVCATCMSQNIYVVHCNLPF